MSAKLHSWFARLVLLLQNIGPYAAIGLVLPGGSLIAVAVWVYRHRTNVLPAPLMTRVRPKWRRMAAALARGLAPAQRCLAPPLSLVPRGAAAQPAAAPRTATCPGMQRRSFRCNGSPTSRP